MADKDIDFDFDTDIQKSSRKSTSRRRRDPIDDDNLDSVLDSALNSTNKPQPLPRRGSKSREESFIDTSTNLTNNNKSSSKAVNSWGENDLDANVTQTSRNRRRDNGFSLDFNPEVPQETSVNQKKSNQRELNKTEELEIPEIPDLEETVDPSEDMAFKVAEAPDVQVHQISTYKELDKEFFKEKAFQFLEGNIDVSLLHCGLSTEQMIAEEEDVIWEWNKLFTEVVSILTTNKDEANEKVDDFGNDEDFVTTRQSNTAPNQTGRREKELSF